MNDFLKLADPFQFSNLSKGSIGFDDLIKRLGETFKGIPNIANFPPYNIKKIKDNTYQIEMAVAGFGKQDIEITIENGVLTINGNSTTNEGDYLYKGIAERSFTRKFAIADQIEVKNAELINGLLKIWLEAMIPESKKPKKIDITSK